MLQNANDNTNSVYFLHFCCPFWVFSEIPVAAGKQRDTACDADTEAVGVADDREQHSLIHQGMQSPISGSMPSIFAFLCYKFRNPSF